MLEKFVASILTSYLGRYIENLDREHVRVSVWRGDVTLTKLEVKKNALRALQLPITVKHGTISLLRVYIPWAHLQSEPIRIEITGVNVVVQPRKAAAYDSAQEEADQLELKNDELASFEAAREAEAASADSSTASSTQTDAQDKSFVERLRASMINNVQLTVRDVSVKYEDTVTDPHLPIAINVQFDEFTVHSCSKEWKKPFFATADARLLHKIVELVDVCLTVETGKNVDYICHPFDVVIHATHQPRAIEPSIPLWDCEADVSEIHVKVDRQQWDAIWRSMKYVREFELFEAFRKFRPRVPPKGNAAEWWNFAIRSVIHAIRQKSSKRFIWSEYMKVKRQQTEYSDLFRRKQNYEWLSPLTPKELLKLQEFERLLPVEVLKRGRLLAYARLKIESQKHSARQELAKKRQQQEGEKKPQGWWAWWTGAAAPEDESPDDEDADVRQVWNLIDADRWTDEQRQVLAKEFGLPDEAESQYPTAPLSNYAKTRVSLHFECADVEALDYHRVCFAQATFTDVSFFYSSTEHTYSFRGDIHNFSLADRSSTVAKPIVTTRQIKDEQEPALRASYEKLNPSSEISFRMDVELAPMIAYLSVPWLQNCVAFWGIDTTLVKAPQQKKKDAAVPPEVSLAMWYEKYRVTEVRIKLTDTAIVIDEADQSCCVNIGNLLMRNSAAKMVEYKRAMARHGPKANENMPKCWFLHYDVDAKGISVDVAWDGHAHECRAVQQFSCAVFVDRLIVPAMYEMPMFTIDLLLREQLQLSSGRAGFFVMFSAISLVTEFMNNASGRKSAVKLNSEVSAISENFCCVVSGPTPRFLHENRSFEAQLKKNRFLWKNYQDSRRECRRYVEVKPGVLTVFHASRPSMASSTVELRPNEFSVEISDSENIVTLDVMQGGAPHSSRQQFATARSTLLEYGIPLITSPPQQLAAIKRTIAKQKISEACVAEIMGAYEMLHKASKTCPCISVWFKLDSAADCRRLERALRNSACPPCAWSTSAAADQALIVSPAARQQQWFYLSLRAPSAQWTIQGDEQGTMDVCLDLGDSFQLEYDVRLLDRKISFCANGLTIGVGPNIVPALCLNKSPPGVTIPSFRFQFLSSSVANTTPEMRIQMVSTLGATLNSRLAAAVEFLWDIVNIILMRHLSCAVFRSTAWDTPVSFKTLPPTIKLILAVDALMLRCHYDDEQETPAMCIQGTSLQLHWETGYAENTIKLELCQPELQALFPNVCPKHASVVSSPSDSPPANLSFTYRMLYQPHGMSDWDWYSSQGPAGAVFTHFLMLHLQNCELIYWQPTLWSILEYFSNGLMQRLSYVGYRCKYTLDSIPEEWPLANLPAPQFSFALMHQNIELIDVVAQLPHEASGEIQLMAKCPRLCLFTTLRSSDDRGCVRNGMQLNIDALSLSSGKRAICNGLSLTFAMAFEFCMLEKELPERSMELALGDLILHCPFEKLALVLKWVCGCFLTPWTGHYPAKAWPKKPFPNLSSVPFPTYQWDISANRVTIHLADELSLDAAAPDAVSTAETTTDAASSVRRVHVTDISKLALKLCWSNDTSFESTYSVQSLAAWDLSALSKSTMFVTDVKEISRSSNRFLRIFSSRLGSALQLRYGWTAGDHKVVFCDGSIQQIDVHLFPRAITTMRDTLLSLPVRNAIAPMFRWKPYVPNSIPEPYDPMKQQWATSYHITIDAFTILLHKDLSKLDSLLLLQLTVQSCGIKSESEKFGKNDKVQLTLKNVLCGHCTEGTLLRDMIVRRYHLDEVATSELLTVQYSSAKGIEGKLGYVWFIVPEWEALRSIKTAVTDPELGSLKKVSMYEEERGTERPAHPAARPTTASDIDFVLVDPCVVVATSLDEQAQRGVVFSLGRVVVTSKLRPDDNRELQVALANANATAFNHPGHYLLKPLNVKLTAVTHADGQSETSIHIEALLIDIVQEYYEALLHVFLRFMEEDETSMVKQAAVDAKESSENKERAELSDSAKDVGPPGESVMDPPSRAPRTQLVVHWERFQLRVRNENVAVECATGLLTMTRTVDEDGSQDIEANIHKLDVGIEGKQPLVTVANATSPLALRVHSTPDRATEVVGTLGVISVSLDQATLVAALSFLYEPYRRIVLPRQGMCEIVAISDDISLDHWLVLSSRKVLRVSAEKRNYITIDCAGHEVHFIHARTPIIVLDAGVTLRFVLGKIHVYDRPIEQYISAGSGSYVVIDDSIVVRTSTVTAPRWETVALPESSNKYKISTAFDITLPDASGAQRSLKLQAKVDAEYATKVLSGVGSEDAKFSISDLKANCLYFRDGVHTDYSSLISEWCISAQLSGSNAESSVLRRNVIVKATDEVQVRLRYGDIQLVISALEQAKAALGHIETQIATTPPSDADQGTEGDVAAIRKDETSLMTQIARIGIIILDDSNEVDIPLIYVDVSSIETPTLSLGADQFALFLKCTWKVDFYNLDTGRWSPFLDPVGVVVVLKLIRNLTLQDVERRKGEFRAGIKLRPTQLHISPMAARVCYQLSGLLSHLRDSAARTSYVEPQTETQKEFFMYEVEQQIAPMVILRFDDSFSMEPRYLDMSNVARFNFPRIRGREIPVNEHRVTLQIGELVAPIQVGFVGATLAPAKWKVNVIVDVQLVEGQKHVLLRTNVRFHNNLPFPIQLEGIGTVDNDQTITVPAEKLRCRCVVVPVVKWACREASMGFSYDLLQYCYDQTFLCSCPILDSSSPQRAVYFLIKFGPKIHLSSSPLLLDCRASFEAPFSITNNTGLPLSIGLYLKSFDATLKQLMRFDSTHHYHHVATVDVAAEESFPVTQLDPLQNIYMDLTLVQPTGVPLGRLNTRESRGPVLIHCKDQSKKESNLVIYDAESRPLFLRLTYENDVTISCPYWLVNQTHHYLLFSDRKHAKPAPLCAGQQFLDGLPPNTSPFLVCTSRHMEQKENAFIYVSIGRHTPSGAILWSPWSDRVYLDRIGALFVGFCGDTEEAVTFSFSCQLVGGALKETKVIQFTPRWIVINRTSRALALVQNSENVLETSARDHVTLPHSHSKTIDIGRRKDNTVSIAFLDDDEVTQCQFSDEFSIDSLSDTSLNVSFVPRNAPTLQENVTVRVSCYTRSSIFYVAVERQLRPQYNIENRTKYLVTAQQQSGVKEFIVYPRTTRGFVWENALGDPTIVLSARESQLSVIASGQCLIDLNPSHVIQKRYLLAQHISLPGGILLYVRVRACGGVYAISVTTDTEIDRVRFQPHKQYSLKLQIDGLMVSAGRAKEFMLLSITGPRGQPALFLDFSQGRNPSTEHDEQKLQLKIGTIQIDDERRNAVKEVVLQTTVDQISEFLMVRRLDRTVPLLQVSKLEIHVRPVRVHLEDSFLFEVIKMVEDFQSILGSQKSTRLCEFENAPWMHELEASPFDEGSLQWRVVFIERLFIESLLFSISLYRGVGAENDPIREKLGMLSIFVRSVQDARFEWRRIENNDLCDKIWLLFTYITNFYKLELEHQVLNVVNVAGLDSMRNIVTDLLEGYFSPATSHIDRSQQMVRRRTIDVRPEAAESDLQQWEDIGTDAKRIDEESETCRCRWIEKQKRKGTFSRVIVSMKEFAHHTTWQQFLEGATLQELRDHGQLALCEAVRTRAMEVPSNPSMCRRCVQIEEMRISRSDALSPLPHPSSGLLDWSEFAHHISWNEFIAVCTGAELQRFATAVKDNLLGTPFNVLRVDGDKSWCIKP